MNHAPGVDGGGRAAGQGGRHDAHPASHPSPIHLDPLSTKPDSLARVLQHLMQLAGWGVLAGGAARPRSSSDPVFIPAGPAQIPIRPSLRPGQRTEQ